MKRASAVVATVLALVLANAGSAGADPPDPSVTCTYTFSQWSSGFSADVTILNNGPDIEGWTVDLAFTVPSQLGPTWMATMSQPDPFTMHAENLWFNETIPSGRTTGFGWIASATEHVVPAMRVNGVPC